MHEAREKTSTKTTKNMEYQQYSQSSWTNHTLHHSQYTNRRNKKNNTIPHYKHRERRHHTRISMDGCIRAQIHMEEGSHPRKRTTHYPPVSQPFYLNWRLGDHTNQGIQQ